MRLAIIDDHPMTCAGLKSLLQGCYPHAVIITMHQFDEEAVLHEEWDYLFLDMHLPNKSFQEVLISLKHLSKKTILISAWPEPMLLEFARLRGVCGFLPKNIDVTHILEGFHRIQQGEQIFLGNDGSVLPDISVQPRLTERQNEILEALLMGLSNKQIAQRCCISEYTVKEHVTAILAAYGVRNRLELLLQHKSPVM